MYIIFHVNGPGFDYTKSNDYSPLLIFRLSLNHQVPSPPPRSVFPPTKYYCTPRLLFLWNPIQTHSQKISDFCQIWWKMISCRDIQQEGNTNRGFAGISGAVKKTNFFREYFPKGGGASPSSAKKM